MPRPGRHPTFGPFAFSQRERASFFGVIGYDWRYKKICGRVYGDTPGGHSVVGDKPEGCCCADVIGAADAGPCAADDDVQWPDPVPSSVDAVGPDAGEAAAG